MSDAKRHPKRKVRMLVLGCVAFAMVVLGAGLATTFASSPLELAAYPESKRVVPAAAKGIAQVSLLPTGTVSSKEGFTYRGGNLRKDVTFQLTAILVEHERGAYLFDAGLATTGQEHFETTPALMRALSELKLSDAAKTRLDKVGQTSGLKGILLSHAHWDHVSGVEDFAASLPVYVHPDEIAFAKSHPLAALARDIGHKLEPLPFDDGPYEMWTASEDVFGDGSVVLVPLPGHTPGSMGLFVSTKEKRFFFVGDLVWNLAGLELREERPWLARREVDVDPALVREQIVRTHRLMQLDPALVVVPAHDERASAAVPTWPERTPK